jgi:hypothetical protein
MEHNVAVGLFTRPSNLEYLIMGVKSIERQGMKAKEE